MTDPETIATRWRSGRSVRASLPKRLMLLVAVVSVPLGALGATALWTQFQAERTRSEVQLVGQAHALAQAVDREFDRAKVAAQTLAASSALARGDMDAFEGELRAACDLLSSGLPPGAQPVVVRLVWADGTRGLDTARPPGARNTGQVPDRPHLRAALTSGKAGISDLFIARDLAMPLVSVAAPVMGSGDGGRRQVVAAVGVTVPLERLESVLRGVGLPLGGAAEVLDRTGATVVGSRPEARASGHRPSPTVLSAIMSTEAGLAPRGTRTREGVPSVIAFAHAPDSRYGVKLDIPEAAILQPLLQGLLRSGALAALVLLGGLALAWLVARQVVAAFRQVPQLAADSASAGAVTTSTGLREADELAAVMASHLVERRQAEQALRDSELRFRTLADAMPQLIWTTTATGQHEYFNARWHAFTGVTQPEAVVDNWIALIHPDDRPVVQERWERCLGTGKAYEAECRLRRHDGVYCWVLARALPVRDADGRILRWFGSSTDIEEIVTARQILARDRQQLEELVAERTQALERTQADLIHAQRLEALGKLAGGIAHDFNNILQAIQGSAALLERRPADAAWTLRMSRMILDSTERGVAISRRLLSFARRGNLRAEAIHPADLLADMSEILEHTLGRGITVRIDAARQLPPFLADKAQLETALINLAMNARDAMAGQGLLTMSASAEWIPGEHQAGQPSSLKLGSYIWLRIADTGAGMDAATLARASEPFFTTKEVGKGTGLGLSMAKGFADQSGGALLIESNLGQGTTVNLWFPVVAETAAAERPAEQSHAQPLGSDSPSLLLVDDEEIVRTVLAEQLRAEGYAVLTAPSGAAALDQLGRGVKVDVLVSDLSMPGMDGVTLVQEAHRLRPDLPAIVLTGFVTAAADLALGGALSGNFSLLTKPVDAHRLADRIAVMRAAAARPSSTT
jgi:PAS domain S-box-containing protein